MSVKEAFDAGAGDYDRVRRQLIPCFEPFYRTAVELLPGPPAAPLRVLDLGAGTGVLSEKVLEYRPNARVLLTDLSAAMLDEARTRLAPYGERAGFLVGDYAADLPPGPFDAVASALSIHHLEDAAKRDLYFRIFGLLAPGGWFVNAEQVAGADPAADALNARVWLHQVHVLGVDEAALAAAQQRMTHDIPAPVGVQLAWLRDAGFDHVDCYFKHYRFAVVAGRRPG